MRSASTLALLVLFFAPLTPRAHADPCGMVPPIYESDTIPLARVGLQKTYVFYKDGVETFVIRPGFTGNVDNFGMLIPFPAPPELRKVPDNTFEQIAAAVDPPEVVVNLLLRRFARAGGAIPKPTTAAPAESALRYKEVKVLKREAVGMYEVAVLAAGGAEGLKIWMTENGFIYPKGMDDVCDDYIAQKWCFVAVKTKVGRKDGVEPQPGQRKVQSTLPSGAVFDGHVQGMGFRFPSKELVVPMRLSAFNEGKMRNIVYLLTEGPRKIRSIPEEYVVRQISGEQLIANLTQPLPVRIIGAKEIPQYMRESVKKRRDPAPKNGVAKELFAADLLAVRTGKLSLPHEEKEKELLAIGESLGLRGPAVDGSNAAYLAEQRKKTTDAAVADLKGMTLTVVDGDFPREVVARENLHFASYAMPSRKNHPQAYDAKLFGPAPKQSGVLQTGALFDANGEEAVAQRISPSVWTGLIAAIALIGFGGLWMFRRAKVAAVLFLLVSLAAAPAQAQFGGESVRDLLRQLSDSKTAPAAVEKLVAKGDAAKEHLLGEAIEGNDITRRGWAIVALAQIGGEGVDETLQKVHSDGNQPELLRTWAAAARVSSAKSTEELVELAKLVGQFPAIGRPIGIRLVAKMKDKEADATPTQMLQVTLNVPALQQALAPAILAQGSEKLTAVMIDAEDQNVRRQAAAYLGTLAGQGDKSVADNVVKAVQFIPEAKVTPWQGGPLFIPGIAWPKEQARLLARNLIAWHLWADLNGQPDVQNQIHNNLRSIALAQAAGYQNPGFAATDSVSWLKTWGAAAGKASVEALLAEQDVSTNKKYAAALQGL